MFLSENKIRQLLNEKHQLFNNKYGASRILGTFIVGIVNYGFGSKEEEMRYIAVYLPTFEEMCFDTDKSESFDVHTEVIDIRKIYQFTRGDDLLNLEILFSNYYIVNNKYAEIFEKQLRGKREKIARVNPRLRLQRVYAGMMKAMANNNNFEILRLSIAKTLYFKNAPCDECFHIKDACHIEMLNSVLNGAKIDANSLLMQTHDELAAMEEVPFDFSADMEIRTGIIALVTKSFAETADITAFNDSLTENEKKAFQAIKNKLVDGTGNISVSKIIEETGISRPVFKNLLLKMENNKIAIIRNEGVKGTHITMEV